VAAHTPAEHRAWAKQNEEAFKSLRKTYPDWAATVLFYVAVHEVQAFLAARNIHPQDHGARNRTLRANWPKTIWPPYESLQQVSNEARYECVMPREADLNRAVLTLAKLRAALEAEAKDPASST
jgi:hypothetical protein